MGPHPRLPLSTASPDRGKSLTPDPSPAVGRGDGGEGRSSPERRHLGEGGHGGAAPTNTDHGQQTTDLNNA